MRTQIVNTINTENVATRHSSTVAGGSDSSIYRQQAGQPNMKKDLYSLQDKNVDIFEHINKF